MFKEEVFKYKNEIVSCVETWIALFDQQHLVYKAFKLCATFEIGFHLDDISSHGPSKGACKSLSSFFP